MPNYADLPFFFFRGGTSEFFIEAVCRVLFEQHIKCIWAVCQVLFRQYVKFSLGSILSVTYLGSNSSVIWAVFQVLCGQHIKCY